MNAIINSGPREDSTRIGRAGTVRRQAVDVSPLRRVNQVIYHIKMGSLTFQYGCLIDQNQKYEDEHPHARYDGLNIKTSGS